MKKNSVIIGGSRGIGLSILKKLKLRKDKVVNISRSGSKYTQYNIKLDLLDLGNLKKIKEYFKSKPIDNLIFCQRYRGRKVLVFCLNQDNPINLDSDNCSDEKTGETRG